MYRDIPVEVHLNLVWAANERQASVVQKCKTRPVPTP